MKKLLVILLLLGWLRPALAQTHTPAGRQRLNVAFVVFPGVEALDLTGPLDVLLTASNLTNGGYHCYTVALTSAELTTDQGGLHLRPDYTFATAPRPDIVVVPGGPGVSRCQQDAAFITQLKALSGRAAQTMSVCTGALLLAQAGVLDGRRATTHQGTTDALAQQFPKVRVVRDVRYVVDGPVLTTAGVTAGLDGAFYLVEQHSGPTVAEVVASTMQYPRLNAARAQQPSAHPAANLFAQAAPPTGQPARAAAGAPLALATDPVCHMGVAKTTKYRAAYQGKTYGFCSEGCRKVFAAKPSQYVR
jgi:transcriptional regulator GlxA family with amidase domain/YHS domain-containing protein